MASSSMTFATDETGEDLLAHLPNRATVRYEKGNFVYNRHSRSRSLYLVVTGKVAISRTAEDGTEVLMDIACPEDLFGESALLDITSHVETAVAVEVTDLMAWEMSEIDDLILRKPGLGVALLQVLARRNADLARRIESLNSDTIERRLARSLIHFSERLGTREDDGAVRMFPFTHVQLARYVGTSREVVTQHMNRFRRQGLVAYSRHGIRLHPAGLERILGRTGCAPAGLVS